jgi:flagellar assembly factor FliW
MRVNTKPFGPVEVDERQKLFFPYGILGFEPLKDYVLLDAAQPPFYWLQSTERPEVAFPLIDPRVFRPDYVLAVDAAELAEIGVESPDQALDFAIVTIPDDPAEMTANLQGPIVINRGARIGRQSISLDPRWKVRHPIIKELAAVER